MSVASESSPDQAHPQPVLTRGVELLGPEESDDGPGELYLVRRGDAAVVRMPWLLYRVASLLDGSRDLDDVADRIGALDGRVCSVEEVRAVVEQRLVPAGIVTMPAGPIVSEPEPVVAVDPGRGRRTGGRPVATLVLGAFVLVAATAAATTLVVGPERGAVVAPVEETATPPQVSAPGGLTGPPTLLGRVIDAPSATTAVVDVEGRPLPVDVAGLDPDGTPACAADDARDFARETLVGEDVTLVPDPTLPPAAADRWRAYLVLGSQLSYTDAAIGAGWATAGEGRYRAGFESGQQAAEDDGVGMFGPVCEGAN